MGEALNQYILVTTHHIIVSAQALGNQPNIQNNIEPLPISMNLGGFLTIVPFATLSANS